MPSAAILVVDDDDAVREVALDAFRAEGVEVFEARDGTEALGVLAAHPEIVLLFSDVRMPDLDGPTLAHEATRMHPHLTVVLTSAWTGDVDLPARTPFIKKPWKLRDLAMLVRGLGVAAGHR